MKNNSSSQFIVHVMLDLAFVGNHANKQLATFMRVLCSIWVDSVQSIFLFNNNQLNIIYQCTPTLRSSYCMAAIFVVQKFDENVENHANVNFCDKNIVIVPGEPTPIVDCSKFL